MHSLRIVPPNSNLSGRCDFWAKKKAPPVGETFLYVGITYLPGKCNVLSCRCNTPVECCRHLRENEKPHPNGYGHSLCWHYLSSRQVTLQVLSAQMSLTSVFGMGTGGPSSQSIPTYLDGFDPSSMLKPSLRF